MPPSSVWSAPRIPSRHRLHCFLDVSDQGSLSQWKAKWATSEYLQGEDRIQAAISGGALKQAVEAFSSPTESMGGKESVKGLRRHLKSLPGGLTGVKLKRCKTREKFDDADEDPLVCGLWEWFKSLRSNDPTHPRFALEPTEGGSIRVALSQAEVEALREADLTIYYSPQTEVPIASHAFVYTPPNSDSPTATTLSDLMKFAYNRLGYCLHFNPIPGRDTYVDIVSSHKHLSPSEPWQVPSSNEALFRQRIMPRSLPSHAHEQEQSPSQELQIRHTTGQQSGGVHIEDAGTRPVTLADFQRTLYHASSQQPTIHHGDPSDVSPFADDPPPPYSERHPPTWS